MLLRVTKKETPDLMLMNHGDGVVDDEHRLEEVIKLLKKFYQLLESRRRRREVKKIRREFERAGYPLDQFRDSQIEAALQNTEVGFTISAKTIYRMLKRLKLTRGEHLIRGVTK